MSSRGPASLRSEREASALFTGPSPAPTGPARALVRALSPAASALGPEHVRGRIRTPLSRGRGPGALVPHRERR